MHYHSILYITRNNFICIHIYKIIKLYICICTYIDVKTDPFNS